MSIIQVNKPSISLRHKARPVPVLSINSVAGQAVQVVLEGLVAIQGTILEDILEAQVDHECHHQVEECLPLEWNIGHLVHMGLMVHMVVLMVVHVALTDLMDLLAHTVLPALMVLLTEDLRAHTDLLIWGHIMDLTKVLHGDPLLITCKVLDQGVPLRATCKGQYIQVGLEDHHQAHLVALHQIWDRHQASMGLHHHEAHHPQ